MRRIVLLQRTSAVLGRCSRATGAPRQRTSPRSRACRLRPSDDTHLGDTVPVQAHVDCSRSRACIGTKAVRRPIGDWWPAGRVVRRLSEAGSAASPPVSSERLEPHSRWNTSMTRPRRLRSESVQSPLETYLREINETPLLTADEEKELAYRIEDGRQRGPRPDGPRQPAPRRQHRPRLHRQGPRPAGPDRGRQPRPAARRRGLRPRR